MNLIRIESISNIESILPLYEISNSDSNLKTTVVNKIKSTCEINLNSIENSNELIDNLIQDEDFGYIEENNGVTMDIDIVEGLEGNEQLVLHLKKERNSNFIRKCKLLYSLKDKYLHCEICKFSYYERYGEIGINFIEGHHKYPISELKEETIMKSTDILMVCSNCHRMIHKTYPCLTAENLKEIISQAPYI